jgi:hypothetical protein
LVFQTPALNESSLKKAGAFAPAFTFHGPTLVGPMTFLRESCG